VREDLQRPLNVAITAAKESGTWATIWGAAFSRYVPSAPCGGSAIDGSAGAGSGSLDLYTGGGIITLTAIVTLFALLVNFCRHGPVIEHGPLLDSSGH
jgi:hypothetical protein